MTSAAATTQLSSSNALDLLAALELARLQTLSLVVGLSEEDLRCTYSPLMSPLVWDLAHIAVHEDLWLAHRFGGLPLLRPDLSVTYDAFETPRAARGRAQLLSPQETWALMAAVRERVRGVMEKVGVGDGHIHEMVIRHEHQHRETMLQALTLAGLAYHDQASRPSPAAPTTRATGLDLIDIAGGRPPIGACEGHFAFDNERPRHIVDLADFRIGRNPVSNSDWRAFVDGGGYEDPQWWSAIGWVWRTENEITIPGGWEVDPDNGEIVERRLHGRESLPANRPVSHVSWYEADAFARAHGMRLPTEAEWETAASWDAPTHTKHEWPWGDEPPTAKRANLFENRIFGTSEIGASAAGRAPSGVTGMIGDVWEWTSSTFGGYPGFTAHPYREYSAPFFGTRFRVLRGGSWATSSRVATATVRNWDRPMRRQIFAGLRLASDA